MFDGRFFPKLRRGHNKPPVDCRAAGCRDDKTHYQSQDAALKRWLAGELKTAKVSEKSDAVPVCMTKGQGVVSHYKIGTRVEIRVPDLNRQFGCPYPDGMGGVVIARPRGASPYEQLVDIHLDAAIKFDGKVVRNIPVPAALLAAC